MLILHIARRVDWEAAQGTGYYSPAEFAREGFIHGSLPEQILGSAQRYYRGQPGLLLAGIDSRRVLAEVRFENLLGGSVLFPHIYGELNLNAVIGTAPFEADETGEFRLPRQVQHWKKLIVSQDAQA